MFGPAGGSKFAFRSSHLSLSRLGGEIDASNHVAHSTTTVATENLDSNNVGTFSDTVLGGRNGTSTVSTMSVPVFIFIILGYGLTPGCTALEFSMVNVDTSIDDVDINTFTASLLIQVLGESAKPELVTVTDSSQTLVRC